MPRTNKRKTNKQSWTVETLNAALNAVKDGLAVRKAARQFGIPESTLRDNKKRETVTKLSLGRKPTFTKDQEKDIADHVIKLSKMFYGITPDELRRVAYEYAERNNLKHAFNKTTKLAGKDWEKLFISRNPSLSLRQVLTEFILSTKKR